MRCASLVEYYGSNDGRQLLLRHAMGVAAGAVALGAIFGDGRVDLTIARWFFDDARHVFPLTDQWLLERVLHDAARTASAVTALALLGLTATSWIATWPRRVHAQRRTLLFASSACFSGAGIVELLKHFSTHACPWDLALFGGTAAYQPLFGAAVATQALHGCSPAAHPLAGYAWLSVGFALYPIARHAAWRAWGVAVALGTLFGVVQILRGAHFLSHVLWTAWVVWGVNVALLTACMQLPARLRSGNRRHAQADAPTTAGTANARR